MQAVNIFVDTLYLSRILEQGQSKTVEVFKGEDEASKLTTRPPALQTGEPHIAHQHELRFVGCIIQRLAFAYSGV